ncbi:hypothetical protein PAERUG_P54_1_London_24_VIM_2_04_13_05795 [Pseudomonas aeruginosa]|nr:hypothetical protein PAERUG_P54_1_London_24_VIM_2_04_13_05795 [Pseudomonas aeruginosa]
MIRAASASPYCRARSTVFGSEIAPSRNRRSARSASRCAAPICRLSWCTATPWSSSHLAASRRPRARQASSTPPRPRKVSAKSQPASRRRCSRSMSPSCAASARATGSAGRPEGRQSRMRWRSRTSRRPFSALPGSPAASRASSASSSSSATPQAFSASNGSCSKDSRRNSPPTSSARRVTESWCRRPAQAGGRPWLQAITAPCSGPGSTQT